MNGDNTYQERNSINHNRGEDIFLDYCQQHNLEVHRLGFDEKNAPVREFFNLSRFIRNLPDFIVTSDKKITLVNVKGSLNFKQKEYDLLEGFGHLYETEHCKLYYCFALPNMMQWKSLTGVVEAYENAGKENEHTWPDGVVYRRLRL